MYNIIISHFMSIIYFKNFKTKIIIIGLHYARRCWLLLNYEFVNYLSNVLVPSVWNNYACNYAVIKIYFLWITLFNEF